MITENGIVTKADPQTAWVKTHRSAACEHCSQKDTCGTSPHGSMEMIVSLPNTIGVSAGDEVIIGMESKSMIFLSFLMYVFPVLLLVAGAIIGDSLGPLLQINRSLLAMIFGFSFFGLAFFIIRKRQSSLSAKAKYRPFLVRKKHPPKTQKCDIP